MLNVFISYARADLERAQQLVAALEARGLTCTIDTRDLPYGERWQGELKDFVKAADAIVFLVSPRSVESKWCKWEVAQVAAQSKRLVPVVLEPVSVDELPPEIGEVHLLPLMPDLPFEERVDALVKALLTDRAWIKEHSRLGQAAEKWSAGKRRSDLVLRGGALREAERWMARRPAAAPAPSQDQLDFIVASQVAAKRRGRMWIAGLTLAVTAAIGLAAFAEANRREADKNERRAVVERDRALVTQSRFLADQAHQKFRSGDHVTAALIALEGLPDAASGVVRPLAPEPQLALDTAWRSQSAQRLARETQLLKGHSSGVYACALSSDGKLAITGSVDGTARIWNVASGSQLAVLGEHGSVVRHVGFTEDGSRAVSVDKDGLRVWDVASGRRVAFTPADLGTHFQIAASNDGRHVLTATRKNLVQLWAADTGKELKSFTADNVIHVWSGPEGPRILTSKEDKVALIDPRSATKLIEFAGHPEGATGAAFSGDGRRIGTLGGDGTLRIWNAADGTQIASLAGVSGNSFSKFNERYPDIALNSDGSRAIIESGREGLTSLLLDVDKGTVSAKLPHGDGPLAVGMFSPDGEFILTAEESAGDSEPPMTAKIWDAKGRPVSVLNHVNEVTCAQFRPDGRLILTASADHTARIWRYDPLPEAAIQNGQIVSTLEDNIRQVEFTPDGSRILTTAKDNSVKVWQTESGTLLATLRGHTAEVTSIDISKDGSKVLSLSKDKTVRLWDLETGRLIAPLPQDAAAPILVSFSHDGAQIATLADDNSVRVWSAWDGALLQVRNFKPHRAIAMSANPHGARIVLHASEGHLELWNPLTGERLTALDGHSGEIIDQEFPLDSDLFGVVASDRTIRIWSDHTGKLVSQIPGPPDFDWMIMSPDGSRLAIVHDRDKLGPRDDRDGRAKITIWDTRSGKRITEVRGYNVPIPRLRLSPDGSRMISSGIDFTRLVDTSNGATLLFEGSAYASAIEFSPDGQRIAINPHTGQRIIDTKTGAALVRLSPTGYLMAFSPDGSRLVVATGDRAFVWNIPPAQKLVDLAKAAVPRCLLRFQRIDIFVDPEPPRWCITGAGREREKDPAKWEGKWPYHEQKWKDWLVAADAARATGGKLPELPR